MDSYIELGPLKQDCIPVMPMMIMRRFPLISPFTRVTVDTCYFASHRPLLRLALVLHTTKAYQTSIQMTSRSHHASSQPLSPWVSFSLPLRATKDVCHIAQPRGVHKRRTRKEDRPRLVASRRFDCTLVLPYLTPATHSELVMNPAVEMQTATKPTEPSPEVQTPAEVEEAKAETPADLAKAAEIVRDKPAETNAVPKPQYATPVVKRRAEGEFPSLANRERC